MGQVLASILSLHADLQAAGLGIPQVGTASHLKVLLLSWGPRLHVHGLDLKVGQVAGTALQGADRDVQGTE